MILLWDIRVHQLAHMPISAAVPQELCKLPGDAMVQCEGVSSYKTRVRAAVKGLLVINDELAACKAHYASATLWLAGQKGHFEFVALKLLAPKRPVGVALPTEANEEK